jgi:hypothetical protein
MTILGDDRPLRSQIVVIVSEAVIVVVIENRKDDYDNDNEDPVRRM